MTSRQVTTIKTTYCVAAKDIAIKDTPAIVGIGLVRIEYRTADRSDQKSNRRRSAVARVKIEFTIHFANLSPVELGALLWTLEMNGAQYHRLGSANRLDSECSLDCSGYIRGRF